MGDNLPELLFKAWRSALADPSEVPVWGNLSAEGRSAWEASAKVARETMAARFLLSIDDALQTHRADGARAVAGVLTKRWGR